MDTTEQCNAVIAHFNGKFIKPAAGSLGEHEFSHSGRVCVTLGWVSPWGGCQPPCHCGPVYTRRNETIL